MARGTSRYRSRNWATGNIGNILDRDVVYMLSPDECLHARVEPCQQHVTEAHRPDAVVDLL